MNDEQLMPLLESFIHGDISAEDHERLHVCLESNASARAVFREMMDLEAGLRVWALEDPAATGLAGDEPLQSAEFCETRNYARQRVDGSTDNSANQSALWRRQLHRRRHQLAIAVATLAIVAIVGFWLWPSEDSNRIADKESTEVTNQEVVQTIGSVRQQDCDWDSKVPVHGSHFSVGIYALTRGVAAFKFDSGTEVILQAPCEFTVESGNSARLESGNVFVNVTELSNGFTLLTPEAEIIDEGTEYAVSLDDESAEVHVFDGAVLWVPNVDNAAFEDRIEAGEAKSYSRAEPTKSRRIPFGQRQFVRRLEAEVQEQAGGSLIAYDGFENLAGLLRRGRSGFGWSAGWQSAGRGRGKLGSVIDAPPDEVFGIQRSGRRLLEISDGDDIRRTLADSVEPPAGGLFISVIVQRQPSVVIEERSLQLSLETEDGRGRRQHRVATSFGVTSEGFPFINNGSGISKTALPIDDAATCLCVFKLSRTSMGVISQLRVFQLNEAVDADEPTVWTVASESVTAFTLDSVRLRVGRSGKWRIDELKVGSTWRSVVSSEQE